MHGPCLEQHRHQNDSLKKKLALHLTPMIALGSILWNRFRFGEIAPDFGWGKSS
jgi:hypothetical protein